MDAFAEAERVIGVCRGLGLKADRISVRIGGGFASVTLPESEMLRLFPDCSVAEFEGHRHGEKQHEGIWFWSVEPVGAAELQEAG